LEHVLFSDGNQKKIAWVIQTNDDVVKQQREHAENYLDKVTIQQSKYIALHVGIFWCIGTFIIKNGDIVKIMLDSKSMFEHLSQNKPTSDTFIENRTRFVEQLQDQRNLKLQYELIDEEKNLAAKLIKN